MFFWINTLIKFFSKSLNINYKVNIIFSKIFNLKKLLTFLINNNNMKNRIKIIYFNYNKKRLLVEKYFKK